MKNQVRIIAGKWRSRKISFPPVSGLRPTPDRVRETLFNWLAPHLSEAICLDLFAGTGILSLEALSRGAAKVTAIEKNPELIKNLTDNALQLHTKNLEIIATDALHWLKEKRSAYDIIFLDPPYQSTLLNDCLKQLTGNCIHSKTLIYFESNTEFTQERLPDFFELLKHKKAGHVYFHLVQARQTDQTSTC